MSARGYLVRQSKPHVRPSPLQVHRHGTSLLDLHLAVDHRLRAPQLNTTSQETCRTHSFRHGNVSHQLNLFVDHVDNHSSQNVPQEYFSTLCSQYLITQHCCHVSVASLGRLDHIFSGADVGPTLAFCNMNCLDRKTGCKHCPAAPMFEMKRERKCGKNSAPICYFPSDMLCFRQGPFESLLNHPSLFYE